MARIGLPRVDAAGLYAWLAKREGAAAAGPGGVLSAQFGSDARGVLPELTADVGLRQR
jgi:hypothetical protein